MDKRFTARMDSLNRPWDWSVIDDEAHTHQIIHMEIPNCSSVVYSDLKKGEAQDIAHKLNADYEKAKHNIACAQDSYELGKISDDYPDVCEWDERIRLDNFILRLFISRKTKKLEAYFYPIKGGRLFGSHYEHGIPDVIDGWEIQLI